MNKFTKDEKTLLNAKLNYIREKENEYKTKGIKLRSINIWLQIGRKVFGTALGTTGLISLAANLYTRNISSAVMSGFAMGSGIYNLIIDGFEYDKQVHNFLKTSIEFHHIGNKIEFLLADDNIDKNEILIELQERIKETEDSAIPI